MSAKGDVLITGAAGRIGRLLMERLPALGWTVRGCDLLAADNISPGDITDLEAMETACTGADSVLHLAATPNAQPGWEAVDRLNIHGTRTVLEAARRAGVRRFVFASSIHTVGGYPADTPLTASLQPHPSGLYGVSKIAGEALLQVYAANTDMTCIALRICSFRPRPENHRELTTWLSHDDCVHLFDRCLAAPTNGYSRLWGVSDNTGLSIDDPTARALGYRPRDDAARFRTELSDTESRWPLLGGPVNGSDMS